MPVGTVEQALALRARFPNALLIGEVDGYPIDGFDFGNSPSAFLGQHLAGRRLIQRTSAGTQGLVLSLKAETLFAGSLVCAAATARAIARSTPATVTLVATGVFPGRDGDEDIACADYLTALLRGEPINTAALVRRVRDSDRDSCSPPTTRFSPPVTWIFAPIWIASTLHYGSSGATACW